MIAGPPAARIAPSTPAPGLRDRLAALTIASAVTVVMSPFTTFRSVMALMIAAPVTTRPRGTGI